jgi:hypothetical protein
LEVGGHGGEVLLGGNLRRIDSIIIKL